MAEPRSSEAPSAAAAPQPARSRSGQKITVGCKLPSGIYIHHERKNEAILAGGAREITYAAEGPVVKLNGTNSARVIGGYGITEGVDADWFATWMDQHANFPPVKAGLIFAHETLDGANEMAKDRADVTSGAEPLSQKPSDDPRTPVSKANKIDAAE